MGLWLRLSIRRFFRFHFREFGVGVVVGVLVEICGLEKTTTAREAREVREVKDKDPRRHEST